jgi:hypothetical protein
MQIALPGIVNHQIRGANAGNNFSQMNRESGVAIRPGVYLISKPPGQFANIAIRPVEFYAPPSPINQPTIIHQPLPDVSSGKTFTIFSSIAGIDTADRVSIELRNSASKWKTTPMQRASGSSYKADVPVDIITPGVINYRIMVRKSNGETYTFPGGFKGSPYAWDEYRNESYQTFVAAPDSPLELFNPTTDRSKIMLYNPDWRANTVEYITAEKPAQLVLKATMSNPAQGQFMGWQYFFGDKISGRKGELSSFTKLIVRARSQQEVKVKVSLITTGAAAYATNVSLSNQWKEIEIPLSSLQKDSYLLLPRPYPGFLPLTFTSAGIAPLTISDIEKLEITFGASVSSAPVSIEIESVQLRK